jgi:predicted enzyme related to lactoylglutathione lyase
MQHAIDWFEIPVLDMTRAMKFYETMSSKKLRREPFGAAGSELAVFEAGGEGSVQGALLLSPTAKPSVTGTIVYLNAAPSIDAWLGRVVAAGGSIPFAKMALPDGMGFIAYILDTEGNRVGLHTEA